MCRVGPESGTTGAGVTLTGTETLTNKTLTSPAINGTVTTTGLTMPPFTMAGNVTATGYQIQALSLLTALDIKGADTQALNLRGNNSLTQATERPIVFYTLNATTDAWVEVFRCHPNGASPTLKLAKAVDANSQTFSNIGGLETGSGELTDTKCVIRNTLTDPSGEKAAIAGIVYGTATTGANATNLWGMQGNVHIRAENTQNWTGTLYSYLGEIFIKEPTSGSYTVDNVKVFAAHYEVEASTTVVSGQNFHINNPTVAGTLTNNYGLYIDDLTAGSSLNYGIYIAGASTYAIYVAADGIYAGGGIVLADAKNIAVNTTTGTQLATATNQKLGFYGATPVDQPDTIADASGCSGDADDKVNLIIDRLQELGLLA